MNNTKKEKIYLWLHKKAQEFAKLNKIPYEEPDKAKEKEEIDPKRIKEVEYLLKCGYGANHDFVKFLSLFAGFDYEFLMSRQVAAGGGAGRAGDALQFLAFVPVCHTRALNGHNYGIDIPCIIIDGQWKGVKPDGTNGNGVQYGRGNIRPATLKEIKEKSTLIQLKYAEFAMLQEEAQNKQK